MVELVLLAQLITWLTRLDSTGPQTQTATELIIASSPGQQFWRQPGDDRLESHNKRLVSRLQSHLPPSRSIVDESFMSLEQPSHTRSSETYIEHLFRRALSLGELLAEETSERASLKESFPHKITRNPTITDPKAKSAILNSHKIPNANGHLDSLVGKILEILSDSIRFDLIWLDSIQDIFETKARKICWNFQSTGEPRIMILNCDYSLVAQRRRILFGTSTSARYL